MLSQALISAPVEDLRASALRFVRAQKVVYLEHPERVAERCLELGPIVGMTLLKGTPYFAYTDITMSILLISLLVPWSIHGHTATLSLTHRDDSSLRVLVFMDVPPTVQYWLYALDPNCTYYVCLTLVLFHRLISPQPRRRRSPLPQRAVDLQTGRILRSCCCCLTSLGTSCHRA
jgi:hypothetical protein